VVTQNDGTRIRRPKNFKSRQRFTAHLLAVDANGLGIGTACSRGAAGGVIVVNELRKQRKLGHHSRPQIHHGGSVKARKCDVVLEATNGRVAEWRSKQLTPSTNDDFVGNALRTRLVDDFVHGLCCYTAPASVAFGGPDLLALAISALGHAEPGQI